MNKAVIYARYSSDSQTEQSIDGQLRVCKKYAERNSLLFNNVCQNNKNFKIHIQLIFIKLWTHHKIFNTYKIKKSNQTQRVRIAHNWRRDRDSNPRMLSHQRFSRPPLSTAQPSLHKFFLRSFLKNTLIIHILSLFIKSFAKNF